MMKKFGTVAVGVTAGLLTMAPLASANEGHGHSHGSGGNIDCSAEGGDVKGNEGKGALGLGIGSAADGNAGQILSCNSFLNDNGNDNEMIFSFAGDDEVPIP